MKTTARVAGEEIPATTGPRDSLAGYSVLIVDADLESRNHCAEIVALLGLRPILAASAEDALEVVQKHQVDIVLADVLLPGMSGQTLLERLRLQAPRLPLF